MVPRWAALASSLLVAACAGPTLPPRSGPPALLERVDGAASAAATAPPLPDVPAGPAPSPAVGRQLRAELLAGRGALPAPLRPLSFPAPYAAADGVFTFRGGPLRDGGAFGDRRVTEQRLEIAWTFGTGAGTPRWGGGAGWTGQPAIVRWPDVVRHMMPALGERIADPSLVEVIQGSLDGNVYFLDLRTGKPTRPPLRTGNPIKGSVSLDPRAYPLLFVGQGIPGAQPIGLRMYALTSMEEVFFLPGRDPDARRPWGAFDSSGLVDRRNDTFLVGGENGLVYVVDLGTRFDPMAMTLAVSPRLFRYRFAGGERLGIEGSLSAEGSLAWFADNGGQIQALDLRTFRPVWAFAAGDDTDASLVADPAPEGTALYTASEVDLQGAIGFARLRRLDALTGAVRWERRFECRGERGGEKDVQAGVFSTPVVGRDDLADRVIFTLSRCPDRGAMIAVAKEDGRELWRRPLRTDAWSSPTAVRDAAAGKTWILQADRGGRLMLVDGADGRVAHTLQLDANVEASPAVFDDLAVVGTRGGTIYGIRIR